MRPNFHIRKFYLLSLQTYTKIFLVTCHLSTATHFPAYKFYRIQLTVPQKTFSSSRRQPAQKFRNSCHSVIPSLCVRSVRCRHEGLKLHLIRRGLKFISNSKRNQLTLGLGMHGVCFLCQLTVTLSFRDNGNHLISLTVTIFAPVLYPFLHWSSSLF
jgi:hypothetical protein